MQTTITVIFCYVDDFLKALFEKDGPQCHLILAELALPHRTPLCPSYR